LKPAFLLIVLFTSLSVFAQEERDTTFRRCPVFITDTVSSNNFFIEGQPCTMRVYRVKGDLTIELRQKDQYLTLFFHFKKLKNTKYKITVGGRGNDHVEARYSFRSGTQVSYVDVSSGTIESFFDKEKNMWNLKVNGLLANMVERSVTYYRVKTNLYFP
jgi:hypothetical protein